MKSIFEDLDNCSRDEALNLLKSILFYYSSLFCQSFDKTLEELKDL